MKLAKYFQLGGHGYLENISYYENKCIANIRVIHPFQQEDISLECEIQGILEEHLLNLMQAVKKGDSVIVSFTAAYDRFKTTFPCFSPKGKSSDEQIIVLGCKLFSVGNCYINGSPVDKQYFNCLAAA